MELTTGDHRDSFFLLRDALLAGNIRGIDSIEEVVSEMFLDVMSYMDSAKEEKFYHNMIMTMFLYMRRFFYVFSNREVGLGRYDLALEPKDSNGYGYIFEFKVAKSEAEMDKLGEETLQQIATKLYDREFRSRGVKNIIKIGMVFYKKQVKFYEYFCNEKTFLEQQI